MYAPRPSAPRPSSRPPAPRRRRRVTPVHRRLAKHTPVLEVSARLVVNGLVSITALGTLSQLVPYIHQQSERLDQINQAVDSATATNTKLKSDFTRHFDPTQTGRLIQEYSGYKSPQERQIVWTDTSR